MVEQLCVKHFGPIPELNITIKFLTFFIGAQGSGKSTISKILTICRDLFWQRMVLTEDMENCMRFFKEYGISDYFMEDSYIRYKADDITIIYHKGIFTLTSTRLTTKKLIKRYDMLLTHAGKSIMQRFGYRSLADVKSSITDLRLLLANTQTLLYIPAERAFAGQVSSSLANLLLSRVPLSAPMLIYLGFFEKAKQKFVDYALPFLNASFHIKEGREFVSVDGNDRKNELPLAACSSGLQSILPLMMVLDYCSQEHCFDSFVIEEPEQNLFPSAQVRLLQFLLEKSKTCHNIIITSHSPYLLSAMNNYLYAGKLAHDANIDKRKLGRIIPKKLQLTTRKCVVYSLGKEINGGEYCKSILLKDSGMIDFNYLDGISMQMGDEFQTLQSLKLDVLRHKRND